MSPLVNLVPAPPVDPSLTGRLRQLARQPAHASRYQVLTSLADALEGDASASHWADMDVYAALDVDGEVDGLRQESRATQVLEALRTAFIFCPLLVTWAGLLLAGRAYNELLEATPARAEQPFLKLWFDGFDGRTPFTLDRLALVTVLLVVGLIVVSVLLQQRHAQDDEAFQRGTVEQNRLLRRTATEVTLALSEHRLSSPERFRAELTRSSVEFGALARDLTSVSDTVTRSLGDLGALAARLEATAASSQDDAKQTAQAAAALGDVLTQLQGGLTTGLRELEQAVAAAHDRLTRQLQDSESSFSRALQQGSQELGQHVDTASGWVVSAAEALLRQSEQALTSSEHVFDGARRAVHGMQERIDGALAGRVGADEVAQAANLLATEARGLRSTVTELSRAAHDLASTDPHPSTAALATSVQSLDRVCAQLAAVLQHTLTAGVRAAAEPPVSAPPAAADWPVTAVLDLAEQAPPVALEAYDVTPGNPPSRPPFLGSL